MNYGINGNPFPVRPELTTDMIDEAVHKYFLSLNYKQKGTSIKYNIGGKTWEIGEDYNGKRMVFKRSGDGK
jgi:hypothetical protein